MSAVLHCVFPMQRSFLIMTKGDLLLSAFVWISCATRRQSCRPSGRKPGFMLNLTTLYQELMVRHAAVDAMIFSLSQSCVEHPIGHCEECVDKRDGVYMFCHRNLGDLS